MPGFMVEELEFMVSEFSGCYAIDRRMKFYSVVLPNHVTKSMMEKGPDLLLFPSWVVLSFHQSGADLVLRINLTRLELE